MTFPNGGYDLQTKWEVNCGATFRFPDISSRFAKCCTYLYPHFDMVHLFHPTFPNGGYELQMKWEVNCGATFRFPDISSRFAKCCTYLDPHFDMVHLFSSYICKWGFLHVQSEYLINREQVVLQGWTVHSWVRYTPVCKVGVATPLAISAICSKNRIGPSTVPWGTPLTTGDKADILPSTTTACCLCDESKKEAIQYQRFPRTPASQSLCRSTPVSTLSKALENSR